MDKKNFQESVYNVVRQIPAGRVLSYGRIASLAGYPSHSRYVGRILCNTAPATDLPCHRVVNASGRIAPSWPEQKKLLLAEGVTFKSEMCVDMSHHTWKDEEIMANGED